MVLFSAKQRSISSRILRSRLVLALSQLGRALGHVLLQFQCVALHLLVQTGVFDGLGGLVAKGLHQGNLREYAPDRSLAFDWLAAVVGKYSALYSVPLENPDWRSLAGYAQARVAHFAELATGRDAVWDRTMGTVTYTAAQDGSLFVTGLQAGPATTGETPDRVGFATYGADTVARVDVAGGELVTLRAEARS